MTVANALSRRKFINFESHPTPGFPKVYDPTADRHPVTPTQRPLVLNRRRRHPPPQPTGGKRLHRHAVIFFHLLKTRSEDVIEITCAVHVLVQIDVVRPYRQLGLKFGKDIHNYAEGIAGTHARTPKDGSKPMA